jgi:predicted RNase H-like HicB family nuclease
MKTFTLQYCEDSGWHVGMLKENPSVFSQGKTMDELVENIKDAYRIMIEESKESIPSRQISTREAAILA